MLPGNSSTLLYLLYGHSPVMIFGTWSRNRFVALLFVCWCRGGAAGAAAAVFTPLIHHDNRPGLLV